MSVSEERHHQFIADYSTRIYYGDQITLSELFRSIVKDSQTLLDFLNQINPELITIIEKAVLAFTDQWNIALRDEKGEIDWDRNQANNSMSVVLHCLGAFEHPEILTTIGKIYMLLWYIDDTMSNDFAHKLKGDLREEHDLILPILENFLKTGTLNTATVPIGPDARLLLALKDIYTELQGHIASIPRSESWFARFRAALADHLREGAIDQDYRRTGKQPNVDQYRISRGEVAGMWVTVRMAELSMGYFFDRPQLAELKLNQDLEELENLTVAFCAFLNDFFSFEKEFFDADSDYNLIPIVFLLNPDLSLFEAIAQAAEITTQDWSAFKAKKEAFENKVKQMNLDTELEYYLLKYTQSLDIINQAAWIWQAEKTSRYKRWATVIKENQKHRN